MSLRASASATAPADPYVLAADAVELPPATLATALGRIGPGMVLAASIVGSGELIATTTLGAQVGYAVLWIILLSCAIKPVVQGEFGRYTIATGHTALEGFNRVPGPRAGVGWLVWVWMLTVTLTLLQVGGMYGGVAQVLHLLVPSVPVNAWVGVCFLITLALLLGGGYERIERFAIVKVGLFTVLTVCAAVILLRRPDAVTLADLQSGLSFELPAAGLATAIAVFGITGVGATELVMYPYWCVEKGYARFVGERDGSAAWASRARGWIRVMHLDITCSLVIYTMATVAFYLLGAGVLHRHGPRAGRARHDHRCSPTSTRRRSAAGRSGSSTSAPSSRSTGPSSRQPPRMRASSPMPCASPAWYPREDAESRRRWRNRFVVVLSVVPVTFYWFLEIAGADGRRRRRGAGADAAAHRRRGHLSAPHAVARRDSSDDRDDGAAVDLERRDAGVCVVLRVVAAALNRRSGEFYRRSRRFRTGGHEIRR